MKLHYKYEDAIKNYTQSLIFFSVLKMFQLLPPFSSFISGFFKSNSSTQYVKGLFMPC